MADEQLGLRLSFIVDKEAGSRDVNTAIKYIQEKMEPLKLKIEFNNDIIKNLTDFNKNINQIIQSTQQQNNVIKNSTDQINKETQAINAATEAQKKYNVEKQKITKGDDFTTTSNTSGSKFDYTTTSQTVYKNGEVVNHPIVQNIDYAGQERANIADYNKMLDEAYKMNLDFDKKAEALDKAHYQALKDNQAKIEAMDKMHYMALKKNRELDLKQKEQDDKLFEQLDRAHYQALQDDQKKFETMDKMHYLALQKNKELDLKQQQQNDASDKQHYLALQQNQSREEDFAKRKLDLITKIEDAQRRFAGDKTFVENLNNLIGNTQQITSIGNYKKAFGDVDSQLKKFTTTVNSAKSNSISFGEALKTAMERFPVWMAASTVFFQSLHFFTKGIAYVNELNATLTQISTAVNYNQDQVQKLAQSYQALAVQMGATTAEISKGALEFYRQGLNDEQVLERLKTTTEYAKISGLEFTQSADLLTAASNSMHEDINKVADVFTLLGDKTATSASEIGISFQKVGAVADSLKIPFEKVASYIATVSAVTREAPETVGSAIKSILSRVESIKKNGYDSTDGTDINQVSAALAKANVQLVDANGQFRNFSQVLDELAGKWKGLDDRTRRYIATTVASTYQQSRFLALMNNYGQVLDLNAQALNAAGTTQSKYNLYLEGTQSHIDRLKATMEGIFSNTFKSDGINLIVDSLTSLLKIISSVTGTFGGIPTIIFTAITAFALFNTTIRTTITTMSSGGWASAIAALSTRLGTLQLSLSAYSASALVARISTIALQATMTMGLSLAITGVISLFTSLISAQSKANEENEKLTNDYKQSVSNINEQVKGLQTLRDEFVNLTNQTNKTEDDKKRLLDIEKQLVTQYNLSATGIDAEGQAYSNSLDAINKRIEALKKEKQAQDDTLKDRVLGSDDQTTKKIESDQKDIDNKIKGIQEYNRIIGELNTQIQNSEQNLPVKSVKLIGGTSTKNVDEMRAIVQGYHNVLGQLDGELKDYKDNLAKDSGDILLVLQNEVTSKGQDLNDKTKAVFDNFAQNLAEVPIDAQQKIDTITELLNNHKLNDLFENYDKLKEKLSKSFDENTATQLKNTIKEIQDSLSGISQGWKLNYGSFSKNMFTDDQQKALNDFNDSLISSINDLGDIKTAADNTAQSFKKVQDDVSNTTKTFTDLASAYDTLNQGESLSASTLFDLISKYPELATYLAQTNDLTFNKGEIIKQVAEIQRQQLLQEVQNEIDSNTNLYNSLDAKRQMYMNFYQSLGNLLPNGEDIANQIFTPDEQTQWTALGKQLDDLKAQKAVLEKPIDFFLQKSKSGGNQPTQATLHTPTDFTKEEIDAIDAVIKKRDENIKSLQTQIKTAEKQKDYNDAISLTNKLLSEQNGKINDINSANQKLSQSADAVRNANADIGKQYEQNGKLFDKWFNGDGTASQSYIDAIKQIETRISNIEGDGQNLTKEQTNQITALDNQKKLYEDIFKTLQGFKQAWQQNKDSIQSVNDTIDQLTANLDGYYQTLIDNADKAQKAVDDINSKILSTQNDMRTQLTSIADQVIQTYKDYYKAQETGIDNQITKYNDLYNAQLKALDLSKSQDDYKKNLQKLQQEQLSIQKDLNVALLNNDASNKKRQQDLQQQLTNKVNEINDLQAQHAMDTRKQALQDEMDKQKQSLDLQKQQYEDLINDDKKYNDIRQQIMSGTFDAVLKDFSTFKDNLAQNSDIIGQHLSVGIIDNINKMSDTLNQASKIMSGLFSQIGIDIESNVIAKLQQLRTELDNLNNQKTDKLNAELSATKDLLTQINTLASSWSNLSSAGQQSAHDDAAKLRAQLDAEYGTTSTYDSGTGVWTVTKNGQKIGDTANAQDSSALNQWYQNQSNLANAGNPNQSGTGGTGGSGGSNGTIGNAPSGYVPPPNPSGVTLPVGTVYDPRDKTWHGGGSYAPGGADYNWLKDHGYIHHDGGVIGGDSTSPVAKALHKLFNLNDNEEIGKLLKGEVVINPSKFNLKNVMSDLMSKLNLKLPDLPNISKATAGTTVANLNLTFNGFSGSKRDAEFVYNEIITGMNKMGVKFT